MRYPAGAILLDARVPADRNVAGLIYGAHVHDHDGDARFVVAPCGDSSARWIARVTAVLSELPGDGSDAAVRDAVTRETVRRGREYRRQLAGSGA